MRFLVKCLGARAVALSPPLRIRIPRPFSLPFLTTCQSPLPEESSTEPSSSAAAAADDGDKELGGGVDSLSARVEMLRRGESVVGAFQSWMGEGSPVHRGHVFHAINRLRKRGMNRRALEVMEWVMRERPYKLTELDYSYLLEFTAKLHGMSQGESLFLRIPHEYQNQLLYNNLVMASLDRGLIKLSYGYMRKMRELAFPISPYVYNRLIVLHSSPGRRKTIPKILRQMKADGVSPHTSTYNILLKVQAKEHNIDGMSKVFDDMKGASVEPNEITYGILAIAHAVARLYTVSRTYIEAIEQSKTGNNWSTLDILLILYGYHGKEKELESTWKLVQELPHVTSKSLLLAIEAFGRVGSISRAEEIWAELKARGKLGSAKYFNSIISAYSRHGRVEKASEVYKEMEANGCKPNAITYRHLALGCLKAGLVGEAVETMNRGKDEAVVLKVRRSTPWLETTFMLLEAFAEIGDVEASKKLFEELKESKYCRYPFVFNALLKAYVKAKVYEPELLNKMILGGARPDAETYSLVRLVEQFKDDRKERRSVEAKKELRVRKQRQS
ncbi:pentatricopeptide repeat-containing protein At1g07590, mitochondrial-like [Ananas comosus]|uniref:Pentatricopeptide repeat-containing protein At1g07590, mitochondrial-like n=1 Tax=Ananas comosus TaxID=4615 RepID=A0A6P5HM35_ANACO|nr:pentatricopeptide repeat-containing protein At1g07590, mitochondrial-like [Ananas comosus]